MPLDKANPFLFSNILHPSDVGLILSYQCQSQCAHCIYNCGPAWKDWMEPQQVEQALGQMAARQPAPQVHISGGEAFLNYPLLLHAVCTASKLGLACYLETNAGWSVNDEVVERRFAELKDAGLLAVLISISPFHAVSIPPKRTLLAIRCAVEVFGVQRVLAYQAQYLDEITRWGVEQPVPLEAYAAQHGVRRAGRLFWQDYGLIAGGRAGYRLGDYISTQPAAAFEGLRCRAELLAAPHSHFDLYGNFLPGFCGGLSLGDWHNLPALVERYLHNDYPQLIAMLIEGGPFALFKLAQREAGYVEREEGYAGKCHLCVDVRRSLLKSGGYAELQPAQFYERLE
jgi:hypothetical protein